MGAALHWPQLINIRILLRTCRRVEIRWRIPNLAYKMLTQTGKTTNSFNSSFP